MSNHIFPPDIPPDARLFFATSAMAPMPSPTAKPVGIMKYLAFACLPKYFSS